MYFLPVKQNKLKKQVATEVFLKGVLKDSTVYRSIQELCSTRSAFAQGLFCNYIQNPWKIFVKEWILVKLQTYSMQDGLFHMYFRGFWPKLQKTSFVEPLLVTVSIFMPDILLKSFQPFNWKWCKTDPPS